MSAEADLDLKHGAISVGVYDGGVQIHDGYGGACVWLDRDGVRWLQALALPTVLAVLPEVPSEPPAKVDEPVEDQIPGQTTIEDALA